MVDQIVQGRKVVARYTNGRLVKGYTFDFSPAQPRFHVFPRSAAGGASELILMRDLKALFFVRDFAGDPARQDEKRFRQGAMPPGQPVEVTFRDGEVLLGTAETAVAEPPGFFMIPADAGSNNLRVFVLREATRSVQPMPSAGSSRPALVMGTRASRSQPTPSLPRRLLGWLTG
jgi:hypothetical protein